MPNEAMVGIRLPDVEWTFNKNSSGDEIANVNFFYNIAHVEASAYTPIERVRNFY